MVTHVFNAMSPLHHRTPGLAGVALVDERVHVGLIADGAHVHPLVLELVRRTAGARTVLVTDATPLADAAAGVRREMAGVPIVRGADGAAHTPDGHLAGSTLMLDDAVRTWPTMTAATLSEALLAATEAPAAAARLPTATGPDAPANLVVLNHAGMVQRVMLRGDWHYR
jgi:N-acetylglucosamine-6-phosphate deacetylase